MFYDMREAIKKESKKQLISWVFPAGNMENLTGNSINYPYVNVTFSYKGQTNEKP